MVKLFQIKLMIRLQIMTLEANIAQHEIKITPYENLSMKLIFLILDEMSMFLSKMNVD